MRVPGLARRRIKSDGGHFGNLILIFCNTEEEPNQDSLNRAVRVPCLKTQKIKLLALNLK